MLAVGVDIGGTTIKTALVEVGQANDPASYCILKAAVTKTEKQNGRESVVNAIVQAIQKVDTPEVQIIGVGSAGDVDADSGVVTYATEALPGFSGLDLTAVLAARCARQVVCINDASAATIGECFFGGGRGKSNVLMVTLGTGLGCSQYLKIEEGLTANAVKNYRLGHIELHAGGRLCLCGKRGCAEQYVSATALKHNAQDEGVEENVDKLLSGFQHKLARETLAVTRFFADFIDTLRYAVEKYQPQLILVGGGVTEVDGWWEAFTRTAKVEIATPICRAELKNRAGILGAVYNALNGAYKKQGSVAK